MSTAPHPTARGLLVWMQTHHTRLLELVAEEGANSGDASPAGDAAIRAHLRFVAEALAANAGPGQAAELEGFATHLAIRMQAASESMDGVLERRLRVDASIQVFLEALDRARPDRVPIRQPTLAWWKANSRRLAHTIFALDRGAKQALLDRGQQDAVADPEIVNQIGQAAMLQGHIKFLVEALAQNL
jgi:hypothetical protein